MGIREELLAIQKESDGVIVAEDVVDWASEHPQSALHKSLEWDNTRAAHEYRLGQVRRLVAIHIVNDAGQRQVVSLSIDRTKEKGGYRNLDDVLPNKTLRDVLLGDALNELDRVQAKYNQLNELASVWAEKEQVRTRRRKAGQVEPSRPQLGAA